MTFSHPICVLKLNSPHRNWHLEACRGRYGEGKEKGGRREGGKEGRREGGEKEKEKEKEGGAVSVKVPKVHSSVRVRLRGPSACFFHPNDRPNESSVPSQRNNQRITPAIHRHQTLTITTHFNILFYLPDSAALIFEARSQAPTWLSVDQ